LDGLLNPNTIVVTIVIQRIVSNLNICGKARDDKTFETAGIRAEESLGVISDVLADSTVVHLLSDCDEHVAGR
jgi:hypothetical protein